MTKLKNEKMEIEASINALEDNLSEIKLKRKEDTSDVKVEEAKDTNLLQFLNKSIRNEERDLECPLLKFPCLQSLCVPSLTLSVPIVDQNLRSVQNAEMYTKDSLGDIGMQRRLQRS